MKQFTNDGVLEEEVCSISCKSNEYSFPFHKESIFISVFYLKKVEEKLKYAKWKAADINLAFKEGRRPTPGPAGV